MILAAVVVSTSNVQGVVDSSCTKEKICTKGYTATVRPTVGYTNRLKIKQMQENGIEGSPHDFEEDHFIPLELCGHPVNPDNLWPEPWPEAHKKDQDEDRLHREVCEGTLTLEGAQAEIRALWKMH